MGNPSTDTTLIREHLVAITKAEGYRHYNDLKALNRTADYIENVFLQYADTVWMQEYQVNNVTYKNVICSFGTQHSSRVIVGAHYDVCGNQEGADDNASGVVGLLELSRLLHQKKLNQRIDLVAFTLEEPPFFRTAYMGSFIHAKSLVDENIPVKGMISLEMIGFFKDEKGTQEYPLGFLKLFYGSRGNYITLVNKYGKGKFARKFTNVFSKKSSVRTKKFTGPKRMPGLDFSDHLNYWKFGFSALMITDTAFYRNKNYHEKTDTLETLDIHRMSGVIDAVFKTLTEGKF